jgi:hypothetical protein
VIVPITSWRGGLITERVVQGSASASEMAPRVFSVRVRAGVAFVVAGLVIGACGGQGHQPASRSSSSCGSGDRYFVLQAPAWELKEAVDYPDELGALAASEPDLDWYSEHERFLPRANSSTVEGQSLRVSGHEAGAAEHASQLRGAELTDKQVGGRRGGCPADRGTW